MLGLLNLHERKVAGSDL